MNILFDNQIFTWQIFGGISRYFHELIKEMRGIANCKMPLVLSNNLYIKHDKTFKHSNFSPHRDFRGKWRIMLTLNRLAFALEAAKSKWDIVHPTYYDPYFLKYIGSKPFVITVHDMIYEKYITHDREMIEWKHRCITKATGIIAISENTKRDIVEICNINPDKITVVHLGHSINPNAEKKIENLPEKYILFVGQRGGYKNFSRFAEAVSLVVKKHPEYHLICTGSPFTTEEKKMLSTCGIAQQTHQYFVSEEELTHLYKNAAVFAFPSEYEGFGIPILEAFACGCPIALSRASSFPEVAGEGGAYFDPLSVEDMARIVLELIENEDYRRGQVARGYQRVKDFSWAKMAQEISEVYQKIIAEKR